MHNLLIILKSYMNWFSPFGPKKDRPVRWCCALPASARSKSMDRLLRRCDTQKSVHPCKSLPTNGLRRLIEEEKKKSAEVKLPLPVHCRRCAIRRRPDKVWGKKK